MVPLIDASLPDLFRMLLRILIPRFAAASNDISKLHSLKSSRVDSRMDGFRGGFCETLQTTTQRARFFGNVARTTDYLVGRRTISLRRTASFADSLLRSSSATSTSPPSSSSSSVGRASTTYVYGQPRRSTPRNCYRCARNGSINAERRWSGVEMDRECTRRIKREGVREREREKRGNGGSEKERERVR